MYEFNTNADGKAMSDTPTGDFVNRNRLRVDPKSGMATRFNIAGFGADGAKAAGTTANAPSFAQKLAALGNDNPPLVPGPTPMATSSPLAKQLAAMGSNLGSTVPDPVDTATRRVQQFTPPTPYRDAQGKTLPQYRMGIGHRILGTLANFANGFAGNRAQPIYVGPGALNNRYYQDEQQRRQNLEAARQELEAIQGPANLRDAIDYRTIGKNPTGKGWLGRTFGGQQRTIARPLYVSADQDDNDENNDNTPQSR